MERLAIIYLQRWGVIFRRLLKKSLCTALEGIVGRLPEDGTQGTVRGRFIPVSAASNLLFQRRSTACGN